MNIEAILKTGLNYPGFEIKKNPNSIYLSLKSHTGSGELHLFSIGDGILLSHVQIEASQWPNSPVSENHRLLLLNYCIKGRCEVELDNGSFTFVSGGELSLDTHSAEKSFSYPGGYYEGMELFLDIEALEKKPPTLFQKVLFRISDLQDKYCPGGRSYVTQAEEQVHRIMRQLKEACKNENYPMVMIKILEWLLLLLELPNPINPAARTCYTATQVRIAKTAEAMITENLTVHYSAKELAERFHISETSLKNYFRGVFGQSYSAYQRDIRMKTAARLLEETSDRIAFIAGTVGYENQSKFASAFKRQYGISPAEYRQNKLLDKAKKEGE